MFKRTFRSMKVEIMPKLSVFEQISMVLVSPSLQLVNESNDENTNT